MRGTGRGAPAAAAHPPVIARWSSSSRGALPGWVIGVISWSTSLASASRAFHTVVRSAALRADAIVRCTSGAARRSARGATAARPGGLGGDAGPPGTSVRPRSRVFVAH
jgi:hypothetical protein